MVRTFQILLFVHRLLWFKSYSNSCFLQPWQRAFRLFELLPLNSLCKKLKVRFGLWRRIFGLSLLLLRFLSVPAFYLKKIRVKICHKCRLVRLFSPDIVQFSFFSDFPFLTFHSSQAGTRNDQRAGHHGIRPGEH